MPIDIKNLTFVYNPKSPFEKKALDDITFTVNDGDFLGIIGSTGSGKSTLIQHLNGLIKLKEGSIKVGEIDLTQKKVDYKLLRKGIGMLFQYPEYQLFDATVLKDVCFGPKNFGMSEEESLANAKEAITLVGLNYDEIKDRSPFELSGGQKRRAAMAGVLAYKPEILILDEPTAGLDPFGKKETLALIKKLKETGKVNIVIMISHNMDEIAEYTGRVILLNDSKLIYDLPTEELFKNTKELKEMGLDVPQSVKIKELLAEKGVVLSTSALSTDSLFEEVYSMLRRKNA